MVSATALLSFCRETSWRFVPHCLAAVDKILIAEEELVAVRSSAMATFLSTILTFLVRWANLTSGSLAVPVSESLPDPKLDAKTAFSATFDISLFSRFLANSSKNIRKKNI